jgi:hypothetical protein
MNMDMILSVCVGLGLAAACGFRVFVPLLVMSIAANAGELQLASAFQWIATPAALVTFSLATALEVGAYYVPWLDNFLDTLATPAAIVAGSVVTASMVTDVSPFLKWSLAVIAGGGIAAAVQTSTVLARGFSLTSTGGIGNPLVATAELGGSFLTAVAAVLAPVLAILLVLAVAAIASWKFIRRRTAMEAPPVMVSNNG